MTTTRSGIVVEGPDAEAYLQGQVSQDVKAIADGAVAWSLVLQPTGRLVSLFRIQRQGPERFLLDVDADHQEVLLARLQRFLLRTKATISGVPHGIDAPLAWPGVADPDNEEQRIRAGMPRLGAELTEDTIPGEAGSAFIDQTVSFTKGCYTGQELVARIDSRGGNVPRPIRVLEAEGPIAVGDEVRFDGDVVGQVTSAAGSVGLAPVARKVEVGQQVTIGNVTAVVAVAGQPEPAP